MQIRKAIIVDDLAADRELAARALRRANWTTSTARNSSEGEELLEQVRSQDASHTVVLLDLSMPHDPIHGRMSNVAIAGASWSLSLRARMEKQSLPRLPIVALTALTEREVLMTALAFGCDAAIHKPVTLNLADRIQSALAEVQREDGEPVGASALLQLLRVRLAETLLTPKASTPSVLEGDVTKAMLAYHRRGLVGLGDTSLALRLFPTEVSALKRGVAAYERVVYLLNEIINMAPSASIELLQSELVNQARPASQAVDLGLSVSEYYRRRREAISVLASLLANH